MKGVKVFEPADGPCRGRTNQSGSLLDAAAPLNTCGFNAPPRLFRAAAVRWKQSEVHDEAGWPGSERLSGTGINFGRLRDVEFGVVRRAVPGDDGFGVH